MPYKVSKESWYSEHQILKIWDKYIQSKGLKYFTSTSSIIVEDEGPSYTNSLFRDTGHQGSMNLLKDAGLLVYRDRDGSGDIRLYRQNDIEDSGIDGKTVSISCRVNYKDDTSEETGGFSSITSDIEKSLRQIKTWNEIELQRESRSIEHTVRDAAGSSIAMICPR